MFKRIAATIFVYFCFIAPLAARLGGGQGHSGGGGGGGGGFGGGSGGSGGGGDITWIIYLVFKYPAVGVPALIVGGFIFYKYGNHLNTSNQTRTISKYNGAAQNNRYQAGINELKQMDPQFDDKALEDRVSKAFVNLQSYWSEGKMGKIRPFVSDGAFESYSILHDRYVKNKLRNDVKDVNVFSCKGVDAVAGKNFHSITFKISASAIDTIRDLESGKHLAGNKSRETFTEYWSFIRKPGAQTKSEPGLMEGSCPNCNYPLEELLDKVTCPSCQALICSGEHDWLLVEISQSNWRPSQDERIPGIHEIMAADPSFNVQAIEDRVSTSFWNVRRAEYEGSTKKLSKYAHPELMTKLDQEFKSSPGEFYADPAVGSVEVLNIQTNDQGFDRVYSKVSWSGHAEKDSGKRRIPDYKKSTRINNVYVFERQSGTQTNTATSLSSAHCPGCGAPASEQTRGNCEYCGTPFNDGTADWVLTAIMPYMAYTTTVKPNLQTSSTTAQPMGASGVVMPVPAGAGASMAVDKELLMATIIKTMLDDNVIDNEELASLEEFMQHLGMTTEHVNQLMNGIHGGTYTVEKPQRAKEKSEIIKQVINLCLLDTKISSSEMKVLQALGEDFGYVKADLKMMISKQRKELYREGKSYLKAHKA